MMPLHRPKRKRGVNLTPQGFQKLQTAKSQAEFQKKCGNRYTLEEIVHLLKAIARRSVASCTPSICDHASVTFRKIFWLS
jgi:hypothetical protein